MDEINQNLADDYLNNAYNFIWAADKLCEVVPENSSERIFRLEDPVTFLIGHAAELTLKAALAYKNYSEDKLSAPNIRHDFKVLIQECRKNNITLDDDLVLWTESISDDFKYAIHKYARSFAGFPEGENTRLSRLVYEQDEKSKKELRKHGLVSKTIIEPERFIQAVKNQINVVNLANSKAA